MACGILVPQPRIEPVPPVVEAQTTREVPRQFLPVLFMTGFQYLEQGQTHKKCSVNIDLGVLFFMELTRFFFFLICFMLSDTVIPAFWQWMVSLRAVLLCFFFPQNIYIIAYHVLSIVPSTTLTCKRYSSKLKQTKTPAFGELTF